MFKFFAIFVILCAVSHAGLIGAPLAYSAPLTVAHAPIAVAHAPIVKAAVPVATSYQNSNLISHSAVPIVAAAPVIKAAPVYAAAPIIKAAPVYAAHSPFLAHY